ncbi:hypothetical protein MLD38_015741 [Melastoma candidum]|uniref:Uncharacterized protein n=1 Tax=Melastoma candidum TaxID=119954 RepID=A0ACB9RQK6_9MYRT|nr:hypothetical protein MLD38_015741 [Melastoma candidum]
MKIPPFVSQFLFWLLVFSSITRWITALHGDSSSHCKRYGGDKTRPHRVTVAEFGAVGDGVTLNTKAFQNAMFYLNSFADKGGAELFIPAGQWLTGSFNLISHLTLSLDRDAVILGSTDPVDWPIVDPLPSYGRGRELPGNRYKSLIFGGNLTDVVITGQNGTIDGQGSGWWQRFRNKTLAYTRPHLIELMNSTEVVISNLTLLNSPFWTVHPVYCSHVTVQNLTIRAPSNSPNTDGVDPDSSDHVCIEDCYISTGDDVVAIKSGWDEHGISFGRPSTKITIRRLIGETQSSGIAIGSEMSGGVSDVKAEDLLFFNTNNGIRIKSSAGRGGYVRNIFVANVTLLNVTTALRFSGHYGEHPDNKYNPKALPKIERITFKDIRGENITVAGQMQGIEGDDFTDICLYNVNLQVTTSPPWNCSNVQGYSDLVSPRPCNLLEQATCSGQDPTQLSSAEKRGIARPSSMSVHMLLISLAASPSAVIARTWLYRN